METNQEQFLTNLTNPFKVPCKGADHHRPLCLCSGQHPAVGQEETDSGIHRDARKAVGGQTVLHL